MRIRRFEEYESRIERIDEPGGVAMLLAGTEYYQRNRLSSAVVSRCTGQAVRSPLELARIDLSTLERGGLTRLMSEGSLFSSGRLFIADNVDRAPRRLHPEMRDCVSSPASNAFLLTTDRTSFDSALMRELGERCLTYVCYEPFDRDLHGWCRRLASENGIMLTQAGEQLLMLLYSESLSSLADAIERVALYHGSGASVGEEQIRDVVDARGGGGSIFELLDRLLDQDAGGATSSFWSLLDRGEDLVGAIGFLYSQWQKVRRIRAILEAGGNAGRVASEMGMRGRMLDRLVKAARRSPRATAAIEAEAFARADEQAKTGGDPYLVAASLVFVLTRGAG